MKLWHSLMALLPIGHAADPQAMRVDAAFERSRQARHGKIAAIDDAIAAETKSRVWIENDCEETRRKREEQERRWPHGLTSALRQKVERLRAPKTATADTPRAGDDTLALARRALQSMKKQLP